MSCFYRETYNYVLSPPPETIEFQCPACKEYVVIELDTDLCDVIGGCDNCGVTLTANAKLIVAARQT